MGILLPAPAEQFLRDLEKALWPIGSDERETILLELRGHLTGCAKQGPDRLSSALASLGSAEACAEAFLAEGAGNTYRRAGLPGRSLVPLGPPPEFARGPEALPIGAIISQVKATYRASRNDLWAVGALLVTVLTGTNFAYYLHELRPDIVEQAWPVALVRLLVILAAMAAAYRTILTRDQRVWNLDLSSLRFAGGMVALAVIAAGVIIAVKSILAFLIPHDSLLRPVVLLSLLLLFSCLYLRVQPWIAALAIDRRDVSLRRVLVETRGKVGAIVKAWAALVLPLCLLHFGLTLLVLSSGPLRAFHLALAGVDGIASACLALSAALLNSTVFRWVTREPIPAPLPFNPELPDERYIEEARARLRRHIEAGSGRFAR